MFNLKMKEIYTVEDLIEESDLQKRNHITERLQEFLSGCIEEKFKKVNWILAKTNDYDYIPWAEQKSYMEIFHEYNGRDYDNGDLLLLLEIPLDESCNIEFYRQIDIILEFFRQLITEANILSCMIHNSEQHPHCHILIDPDFELPANFRAELKRYLYTCGMTYEGTEKTENSNDNVIPYLNKIDYYTPEKGRGYNPQDSVELIYDAKSLKALSNPDMKIDEQEVVLNDILEYFTRIEKRIVRSVRTGMTSKEDFVNNVKHYLKRSHPELNKTEIKIMLSRVDEAIFGYYVLDDLINDDSISDIKVIAPDKIRIKRYGKRLTSNLYFRGSYDYYRFCEGVALRNHSNLEPENAIQNFTDKTTNSKYILRFNLCTDYVNSVPYPYLHIRKISRVKKGIEDLFRAGMFDLKTASYLLEKVKSASGILFTGKGGSGKTTLMNTLLEYIPYTKSGLVIQENEELFTYAHPDIMFQHTVTPRHFGERAIELEDEARNGLLTDLDYFIIGEIKGKEALPFLMAAFSGHQCWASVHGASSTQALDKLADYVKYASDYSREDALKMLMSLEIIIFMKDYKVWEISEIDHWDYEKGEIIYKKIWDYENTKEESYNEHNKKV